MFLPPPSALMKLSITSLPLARVKSPVWLRTTLRLAFLATTLSKPFLRLVATLAPTVPCSSTTLQALPATVFASHSPATAPSCTLSEVTAVRYSSLPEGSMSRSSSTTGILASLASFNTASQPLDTTGARKMASTPCAIKERIALIWFSCFCCASAILSVTLRLAASVFETEVSAARQPDSDPIWEKPTVSSAAVAGSERLIATKAVAARRALEVMRRSLPKCCSGCLHPRIRYRGTFEAAYWRQRGQYFTEDWF